MASILLESQAISQSVKSYLHLLTSIHLQLCENGSLLLGRRYHGGLHVRRVHLSSDAGSPSFHGEASKPPTGGDPAVPPEGPGVHPEHPER